MGFTQCGTSVEGLTVSSTYFLAALILNPTRAPRNPWHHFSRLHIWVIEWGFPQYREDFSGAHELIRAMQEPHKYKHHHDSLQPPGLTCMGAERAISKAVRTLSTA